MKGKNKLPIGFFDSGVGGISVLREAIKELPNESFIYYGDNGNAPYGVKDESIIRELSIKAADFLVSKGIKALVVACNTATSAAIQVLRDRLDMPVIGMEPALKPAVEMSEDGKIIVMATPATLRQKKFCALLDQCGKQSKVIPLPCPGLMELIEKGDLESEEIVKYLECLLKPYFSETIDIIVLGCTHYVFVADKIQRMMGEKTKVIDGNHGTVMQLKRILIKEGLLNDNKANRKAEVQFYTSGKEEAFLSISKKLLNS